jgi:hypothetical protein
MVAFGQNGGNAATNGRIWVRSNGLNFRFNSVANTLDYSEYLQQEDTSEPGDVMVMSDRSFESVKKSTHSYDQKSMGVVTQYGTSNNNEDCYLADNVTTCDHAHDPHYANVGMLGQLYTKVSTENGSIVPGDPLTTSSATGAAMKALKTSRIIGYALDYFDGTHSGQDLNHLPTYPVHDEVIQPPGEPPRIVQIGKIIIFLQAGWYDPNAPPPDIGEVAINESGGRYSLTDTITGNAITAQTIAQDGLIGNLRTGQIDTNQLRAEDIVTHGFTIKGTDNQVKVHIDSTGNASFNGTITADRIIANHIDGLDVVSSRVDQLQATTALLNQHIASVEAAFDEYVASHSGEMTHQESPVPTGILSLDGLLVSKDATVSGTLHVGGSTLVEGILSVIDTITSKNLLIGEWADFMGNSIFRGNTLFEGRPTFNNDTAGFAVVKAGQNEIDVTFDKEYETMPVVNVNMIIDDSIPLNDQEASASAVLSQDVKYIVTKQTTKGFAIQINHSAGSDLRFSWVAIAVKDAKTSGVSATPTPLPTVIPTSIPTITPTVTPTITPTTIPSPTPTDTVSPTPTP